jgi:nitrogen fixation NifU-like protein
MNPADAPRAQLEDLYQEVILDHNRRPRNFKALPEATAHCHGFNPLCGDDYDVYLAVDANGIVQDVAFQGKGCAISKASGSMMTAKVKGKSLAEARHVMDAFLDLTTRDAGADPNAAGAEQQAARAERLSLLGSLSIFEGVKKYPMRVKCATLVWHALDEALQKSGSQPTTGRNL